MQLLWATFPQPPALCLATFEVLLPRARFRIKNVSFLAFSVLCPDLDGNDLLVV